jgi:hypothetical protein
MINTTNLLDYQVPHVKRLVDSLHLNGYAADLSDTGTGKTFCAAATARELNCPVFVICPKPVVPAWKEVLQYFGIDKPIIRNYESLIRGNRKSYYTSWETEEVSRRGQTSKVEVLRFNSRVPANTLFIFDEVHRCKATDSINSELLMTIRDQGFKCLKVSASAATNPVELKAFGYVSRLHNFKDGNDFKRGFAAQNNKSVHQEFVFPSWEISSQKTKLWRLRWTVVIPLLANLTKYTTSWNMNWLCSKKTLFVIQTMCLQL